MVSIAAHDGYALVSDVELVEGLLHRTDVLLALLVVFQLLLHIDHRLHLLQPLLELRILLHDSVVLLQTMDQVE